MEQLQAKTYAIRKDILDMVYRAKTGHIGGDFSVCDILTTLYHHQMQISPETMHDANRDRFIMSKGHSVEALYCVLASRGFFPKEDLLTFSTFGSKYIGHPNNKVNGIEMNSGSLGHGLPVSVGMALAAKMDGRTYRTYVVMGDGELAEGSVWEGFMSAGHYHLDNLTAVIDRNRLQISGGTETVMHHDNLEERIRAFDWNVLHADGNCIASLDAAFALAKSCKGKPTVVIADTVKGCGVSFMENQVSWHHRVPTAEEYEIATKELAEKEAAFYE
ncbi:MAG: transketolase [Ruthenibacterium sp.]